MSITKIKPDDSNKLDTININENFVRTYHMMVSLYSKLILVLGLAKIVKKSKICLLKED